MKARRILRNLVVPVLATTLVLGAFHQRGSEIARASQTAENVERSYDSIIKECVDRLNSRFKPERRLEYNTVKSMIPVEAPEGTEAYMHDPMQVANKGDGTLEYLLNDEDHCELIDDFRSFLSDKIPTPRKNGKWDYSNSNMTPEASIRAGVGLLFRKVAKFEYATIEEGEMKTYAIKSGDNFAALAKKLDTTRGTFLKYNPDKKPERLQIGDVVKYKTAHQRWIVTGFGDPNTTGVKLYNGGGDETYFERVSAIKAELDKLDRLRSPEKTN